MQKKPTIIILGCAIVIFAGFLLRISGNQNKELVGLSKVTLDSIVLGTETDDKAFGGGVNSPRIFALTPINTNASGTHIAALTVGTSTLQENGVTSTFPGVRFAVDTRLPAFDGIVAKGVNSQAGNLYEARTSNDNIVWSIGPDGSISTSGTLRVGGSLITNGSLNPFVGDIVPTANNAQDIGASTSSIRDVYTSGTAYIKKIVGDGLASAVISSSTPQITEIISMVSSTRYIAANSQPGFPGYAFSGNANASSTGFYMTGTATAGIASAGAGVATFTQGTINFSAATTNIAGNLTTLGVRPTVNNLYDIGSTAFAYRDIYTSGTLRIGGAAATSTIDARTGTATRGTCNVATTVAGTVIYWWIDLASPTTFVTSTTSCL